MQRERKRTNNKRYKKETGERCRFQPIRTCTNVKKYYKKKKKIKKIKKNVATKGNNIKKNIYKIKKFLLFSYIYTFIHNLTSHLLPSLPPSILLFFLAPS